MSFIASSSSTYGRRCARCARRREVVRAVEVDRIDLVERDEARDLDRARVVGELDRLEVGVLDDDELALRDLPALDDLVRPDLAIVRRAPALLPDRRPALAVELPERHVGRRAFGDVASASPTGMLTRPKLSEPFQIVRI